MPEIKKQSEFNTQTPEINELETAKVVFLRMLESGEARTALKIKDKFNIPKEFLESTEVIEAVEIDFLKMV